MNRLFFNLVSKDRRISDTRGAECGDLASAHRHAMIVIHKLVLMDEESDWQGWSIDVTDASNRSVLSVLFPQMSYFPFRGRIIKSEERDSRLLKDEGSMPASGNI